MAEITAALVKELREKSGAGMMDCKKALTENDGDMEAAIDWLRTKGLSKAAKKAGRVAAEGLVAVAVRDDGAGMTGAAVEVNAETDFVARNELFQDAARKHRQGRARRRRRRRGARRRQDRRAARRVGDVITNLIATIGENMMRAPLGPLRRSSRASSPPTSTTPSADGLGSIGVLVALEGAGDQAELQRPRPQDRHARRRHQPAVAVDRRPRPGGGGARTRDLDRAGRAKSGKPRSVIEKMVEGRMRKFYEEVVLLKQAFVMNPDQTVEQLLAETGKDARRAGQDRRASCAWPSAKASRRRPTTSPPKSPSHDRPGLSSRPDDSDETGAARSTRAAPFVYRTPPPRFAIRCSPCRRADARAPRYKRVLLKVRARC